MNDPLQLTFMPTTPVSLRLEEDIMRALRTEAKRSGVRPSEYIREATLEKLGAVESRRTSIEIGALRKELENLREDFALMAEVLLLATSGGLQKVTPESAGKWVRENLRSRKGAGK